MRKTTQKGLQALVYPLSLPICLRMVSCAHPELSARHLEQLLPKLTGKDFVTVGDEGQRHAM